jgi:transposase-like protein
MSGKRRKYTPEFREQAARLVIETGRPVAHVAAEIGVGEQVLGRWVRRAREAAALAILARCSMLMNAQSWSVCAGKTPNYGWTVHF